VYGSLQQGSVKSSLLAANSDGVLVAATGVSDFIKVGINNLTATGTPSNTTFLRGDNTWATITSLSGSYQPLDSDLTAIAGLSSSSGLLRKIDAATWQIDTAEYVTIGFGDGRYQVISNRKSSFINDPSNTYYYSASYINGALDGKMGVAGGTFTGNLTLQSSVPSIILNDTSSGGVYRLMVDGGQFFLKYGTTSPTTLLTVNSSGVFTLESTITATGFKTAAGTSSQFLKANGSVDSTSYQPLDSDLTAIAALTASSGLLRKVDSLTWQIDTAEYVTIGSGDGRYQIKSDRKSSFINDPSNVYYYSASYINGALDTKMGVAGGTFTGNLNLQSSVPSVILNDTSSGGIFRIVSDGGQFFVRYGSGATTIVTINSSGNITANAFVKDGGSSSQFLMANGSVSTNPGWITGITSGNVISALGYTPYNSTNPSGYLNSTSADSLYLRLTGGTLSGSLTATAFYESSDKNLKTLIATDYKAKDIESIVSRLYIKNGKEELGYFAQDVESILPSAVFIGADGYLSLSYREVHTAKIAYLEKEVSELKAQLARL
jgi:hypothetical protein